MLQNLVDHLSHHDWKRSRKKKKEKNKAAETQFLHLDSLLRQLTTVTTVTTVMADETMTETAPIATHPDSGTGKTRC